MSAIKNVYAPKKVDPPVFSKKNKVIIISGPTATGKTKLSLELAKILGGEIVSADSMQIYRGMDIGTAKVSREMQEEVPHHLIDIRDLADEFNVVDFYEEAMRAIRSILARNKVPIIVGGTGFYIQALIYGPPIGPPSVPDLRARIETQMEQFGPEALYQKLEEMDPEYAHTITKNDRHKIVRALEIMAISEKKVSDYQRKEKQIDPRYNFRCWFIYYPKTVLYPRIEKRCESMIQEGFLDEVKELDKKGLSTNRSACQAIGYRQCLDYLYGPQTKERYEVFLEEFKKVSRRYAKRQFTWFRKESLFHWINLQEKSFEFAKEMILQDYEQSF